MEQIWHVTIATIGRLRPFSSEMAIYAGVRAVVRVGGRRLLLFCLVDDHVHVVVVGSRIEAGRASGGLARSLHALDRRIDFDAARIRPVASRKHLETLVDYIVRQPEHHGIGADILGWPGSCLPDLLEARDIGFDARRLRAALPRWRPDDLLRALGVPPESFRSPDLGSIGLTELMDACGAAFGVASGLSSRTRQAARARRVAAALARRVGFRSSVIADAIQLDRRQLARTAQLASPADLRTANRALALRSLIRERT